MKGKQSLPLQKGQNKLKIFTPVPLLFSINGKPEYACGPGKNRLTVRLENPEDLAVDPADSKSEYSIDIDHYVSSSFETINDDPPPQPKPPANWLQAIRQKVQKGTGYPEQFNQTGYEADDHEWEEDQLESLYSKQKIGEAGETPAAADNESAEQGEADQNSESESAKNPSSS